MDQQVAISEPEARALVSLVQSQRRTLQDQGLAYRQAYAQALCEVGATEEQYKAAMRIFGSMSGGRRKKQEAAQPALPETLKTQIDAAAQAARAPERNYSELYEQCLDMFGWVPDDPAFILLTGCGKSTPSVIRNAARKKGWALEKRGPAWFVLSRPKSEREKLLEELEIQRAAMLAEYDARIAALKV